MDLDSLIQLIVLLGAGLAWLFGGTRRQREDRLPPDVRPRARTGPRGTPRRPRPKAGPTTTGRFEARAQARRRPEPAAPRREATLEDLYRILSGQPVGGPVLQEPTPAEVEPSASEAEALESIPGVEARSLESVEPVAKAPRPRIEPVEERSLETLEPAGTQSHQRFHELYLESPQPPRRRAPRLRLALGPSSAREGILWREVLGPPKGLR